MSITRLIEGLLLQDLSTFIVPLTVGSMISAYTEHHLNKSSLWEKIPTTQNSTLQSSQRACDVMGDELNVATQ